MQDMDRMIHLCLQCTINMWVDCSTATKLHFLAEIISSFVAEAAISTVNARLYGYAVTDREVLDALSDCCDNTGGFVT
jgi:hypothetical protein